MSELESYIQSYFGIESQELHHLSTLFKEEKLGKGDFYLLSGKSCDKLSFIKSGLLRIFVQTKDKEVTQWISSKGYFVTDLAALVFSVPSRWNIQALTDTELYTIQRKDYERIAHLIPKWHQLEKLLSPNVFQCLKTVFFHTSR